MGLFFFFFFFSSRRRHTRCYRDWSSDVCSSDRYHAVPYDLSSVGGPVDGKVFDGIVQEIDVATGRVLFEWHSLDHVPLTDSYQPLPSSPGAPWDYFHINSINLDSDQNLLISARHTWAIYKIDRRTGDVIWRLGGKESDFALGPGAAFAWQHDV